MPRRASLTSLETKMVPGCLESVPVAVVQAAVVELDEGLAVAEVVAHVQTAVREAEGQEVSAASARLSASAPQQQTRAGGRPEP